MKNKGLDISIFKYYKILRLCKRLNDFSTLCIQKNFFLAYFHAAKIHDTFVQRGYESSNEVGKDS